MFAKRDYLAYFRLLLVIEREMEKEGHSLYRMIKDNRARALITKWIADEKRHTEIVERMIAFVE